MTVAEVLYLARQAANLRERVAQLEGVLSDLQRIVVPVKATAVRCRRVPWDDVIAAISVRFGGAPFTNAQLKPVLSELGIVTPVGQWLYGVVRDGVGVERVGHGTYRLTHGNVPK
jgi:hypothetical protein